MTRHEQILNFIKKFSVHGKDVISCFTQGCCYWFAQILLLRFKTGHIVYDGIFGHFGYMDEVTNEVYDITGAITKDYQWIDWFYLNKEDISRSNRIIKNCILMEDNDE